MTIKVTRQKNFYGSFARIKLYAGDQMLAKLKNGETYIFEPDSNLIHIRTSDQIGGYSNKIEVNDDSSVIIKVNPFSKTLYFSGVIGILIAWLFKFDLYIVSSIAFFIIAFIALNKSHILSVDKKPGN
jgi:hypothetical protein